MEPTTWSGKRLIDTLRTHAPWFVGGSHEAELLLIAAIEAEAVAARNAEIRAAVEKLPVTRYGIHGPALAVMLDRAAVLAIVDPRP